MALADKVIVQLMANSKMSAFAVQLTPEMRALCEALDGELAAIRQAQREHARKLSHAYTADHGA